MAGDAVKELQRALQAKGYEVTADGKFGAQTARAVKAFQQGSGLAANGIVGARTMARLRETPAAGAAPLKGLPKSQDGFDAPTTRAQPGATVRGKYVQPLPPPGANAADPRYLGGLSSRYESNGDPGIVSSGKGDAGGVSYGTYQFSSKTGSAQAYVDSLKTSRPQDYEKLKGLTPGSPEFSDAWKAIAKADPQGFGESQHAYIAEKYYAPARASLESKNPGLDLSTRSRALNDVIWSTAVQHGPGFAAKALKGQDLNSMSDEQIIKAIYAERGREAGDGSLVHFKGCDAATQRGVKKRFERESTDALRELRSPAPAPAPAPSTPPPAASGAGTASEKPAPPSSPAPTTESPASTAQQLIDRNTSWGALDEEAIGAELAGMAKEDPARAAKALDSAIDQVGSFDKDDISVAFCEGMSNDALEKLALAPGGAAVLEKMRQEMASGWTGDDESAQIARIDSALASAAAAPKAELPGPTAASPAATPSTPAAGAAAAASPTIESLNLDRTSTARLKQLDPQVQAKAIAMIAECQRQGIEVAVTSGLRTFEEQERLYNQGRTTPGNIVTNAKPGTSWHNYGVAFDIVPLKGGKPDWKSKDWDRIGKIGKDVGLTWGGDFKTINDKPHFEYHPGVSVAEAQKRHAAKQPILNAPPDSPASSSGPAAPAQDAGTPFIGPPSPGSSSKPQGEDGVTPYQGPPVPTGKQLEPLADYKVCTKPDAQVVAKANEVLRKNLPVGSTVDFEVNGKKYKARVEWHKHAPTDNVPERLKDWHHGVTMYESK